MYGTVEGDQIVTSAIRLDAADFVRVALPLAH